MYDIIFIGHNTSSSLETFKKFQEKFPTVKHVINDNNIQEAFQLASKKSFTKMFWAVWDDLVIRNDFKFDYKVPEWDEKYIHVFKNAEFYDGVCLFPKSISVNKRELEYRFFTDKKEIDIVASSPLPYDKYYISTYDEYLDAVENSTRDMFWVIWNDLNINDSFNYDYYIPVYDSFHKKITHIFKNGEYYDGVCLFSKNEIISSREFNYRFFSNKKEVDIVASLPKPFDIVFISYKEPNADMHYDILTKKLERHVYRVDGVKGIHNAHRQAAMLVKTEMFWVVDADAVIVDDFNFDYQVAYHNYNTVHVWRSSNPINNLEYGYGGVKLLPTKETLGMDMNSADMTTSISPKFQAIPSLSNITAFNTDEFTTWRSAFRECCKLASRTIQGQVDDETAERLDIWCSVGSDKPYGKYAILGALAGKTYGQENASDKEALSKINDFTWLQDRWQAEISQQ